MNNITIDICIYSAVGIYSKTIGTDFSRFDLKRFELSGIDFYLLKSTIQPAGKIVWNLHFLFYN